MKFDKVLLLCNYYCVDSFVFSKIKVNDLIIFGVIYDVRWFWNIYINGWMVLYFNELVVDNS